MERKPERRGREAAGNADQRPLVDVFEEIFADKARVEELLSSNGDPAQVWLDKMQELAESPYISSKLRSSLYSVMLRLSKNTGLHPTCLMIHGVRKEGKHARAKGGSGDVWKGYIGESTEPMSLKIVKLYMDSDIKKLSEEYLREAILWRQLKHPNLLPFLGIYYFESYEQLCLISPWMERGNLIKYLKATPRREVDHYRLATDVASGLSHLHLQKIIHGDLKGLNILITDAYRACIGDFGLSRVADTYGLKLATSTTRATGTARWQAPELIRPPEGETSVTSKASDMYSYACVCYEIFTSERPFHEIRNDMTVALKVLDSERPDRPQVDEVTDEMWGIMETCWDAKPSSRLPAMEVLDRLVKMKSRKKSSFSAPQWSEALLSLIRNHATTTSVSSSGSTVSDDTSLPEQESEDEVHGAKAGASWDSGTLFTQRASRPRTRVQIGFDAPSQEQPEESKRSVSDGKIPNIMISRTGRSFITNDELVGVDSDTSEVSSPIHLHPLRRPPEASFKFSTRSYESTPPHAQSLRQVFQHHATRSDVMRLRPARSYP